MSSCSSSGSLVLSLSSEGRATSGQRRMARSPSAAPRFALSLAEESAELLAATEIVVEPSDSNEFDALLHFTEEGHGEGENGTAGDGDTVGGAPARTAAPGVLGSLSELGQAGGEGGLGRPGVTGIPGGTGDRSADAGPAPAMGKSLAPAGGELVGNLPVVAGAETREATDEEPARRGIPRSPRERAGLRQAGARGRRTPCAPCASNWFCGAARSTSPRAAFWCRTSWRPNAI